MVVLSKKKKKHGSYHVEMNFLSEPRHASEPIFPGGKQLRN
jgi:hypothetical protein